MYGATQGKYICVSERIPENKKKSCKSQNLKYRNLENLSKISNNFLLKI